MVGSKIHPPAESTALAIEQQVVAEVCQSAENTARLLAEVPGTYRDLLIFLGNPSFEWHGDQSLQLTFDLPAGAYATEVLRELTRRPWESSALGQSSADPVTELT
jgi:tRNA pseudouridine13 synthase